MLKRIRKSSSHVTLVLIGAAALTAGLSGCSKDEVRRDVYASKADCLADWGNTPTDCEPAYDRPTGHGGTTHYYGRPYTYSGATSSSPSRSGKTIGSSTTSRGGFGSSGRSSAG
jgi:uncharacterized protein YgiB involved in biofilm formation